jgi:hypothetical protein
VDIGKSGGDIFKHCVPNSELQGLLRLIVGHSDNVEPQQLGAKAALPPLGPSAKAQSYRQSQQQSQLPRLERMRVIICDLHNKKPSCLCRYT